MRVTERLFRSMPWVQYNRDLLRLVARQVTSPLVKYYKERGVLETFQGTESDKIYPNVKNWLEEKEIDH